MIVTKQQLQQLIDEEFSRALEKRKKALNEGRPGRGGTELWEMESYELIEFAKAYAGLGDAVQDQLHDILDNADNDEVNPNAIDLIEERLGGFNEEIDDAITAYKEYQTGEPGGRKSDEDEDEEDDGSMAYAAKVNRIR